MVKRKYRLKGHESFILRDGWLTKGIQAVEKDRESFQRTPVQMFLGLVLTWQRRSGIG